MDVNYQLVNAIEAVSREYTVGINAGLGDGLNETTELIFPFIRIVDRVGLTEIEGIGLEEGRVNRQEQVLYTITTVDGLTGPLVCTGDSENPVVEDIRLFIRDVLLINLVRSRVNTDDIFDDRVASIRRRNLPSTSRCR